jgi:transcriptional regulator with XRE-family HTH domain
MKEKSQNLIKLGKKIQGLRQKKGFSQEGFAMEVELDRSYMGGIERGERNVSALNLIKIAKALKVDVGELFPSIKALK